MKKCILWTLGLLLPPAALDAGDWPQFRGPGGAGVSAEKGLPDRWSDEDNLRWKAVLPGRGQSSPVVAGGRVYLTACSGATQDRLHVLCFDARTGKRLWAREFWATGETISHPKTSMAASGPRDRRRPAVCVVRQRRPVLSGPRRAPGVVPDAGPGLSRRDQPHRHGVLAGGGKRRAGGGAGDGRGIVRGRHRRPDGRNRWKVERPRAATWTTPLVWTRQGRTEVVLQSGEKLSGHDVQTGDEHWSFTGKELAKIASPVAGRGIVLAATREELLAIRPGKETASASALVWQSKNLRPATATPLVYQGHVYSVSSAGLLTCGEASTGKDLWRKRVAGPFSASPVMGDGKLYIVGERGVTTVVQLSKEPRILSSNDLGETLLASPALADGACFCAASVTCSALPRKRRRTSRRNRPGVRETDMHVANNTRSIYIAFCSARPCARCFSRHHNKEILPCVSIGSRGVRVSR